MKEQSTAKVNRIVLHPAQQNYTASVSTELYCICPTELHCILFSRIAINIYQRTAQRDYGNLQQLLLVVLCNSRGDKELPAKRCRHGNRPVPWKVASKARGCLTLLRLLPLRIHLTPIISTYSIRAIATYSWELADANTIPQAMERLRKLQYKAVRKVTGGYHGSRQDLIGQISKVELVQVKLWDMKVRVAARILEKGLQDDLINQTEKTRETTEGRSWQDHRLT